jgi:uncharacterized membrane protein AbrB (regulator of aidB expression)
MRLLATVWFVTNGVALLLAGVCIYHFHLPSPWLMLTFILCHFAAGEFYDTKAGDI